MILKSLERLCHAHPVSCATVPDVSPTVLTVVQCIDVTVVATFRDGAPFIEWASRRLESDPQLALCDVLFVDMHMQTMHGNETLQRLEQLHSRPGAPPLPEVVALSGDADAMQGALNCLFFCAQSPWQFD